MKWLNGNRTNLMLVGCGVVIMLGGGPAKADFTFGEPTNLGPTINSSATEGSLSISADGLEGYFASYDKSGSYGHYDIWLAKRETTDDDWGSPVNLGPTINTPSREFAPDISADGLTLYFCSDRSGGYGDRDIWMTRRASMSDHWREPENLGPIVNSPYGDGHPNISSDGLSLYFNVDDHPGGYGSSDLWVATRLTTDDPWSLPVHLGPTVNSSHSEYNAEISADGLALFFVSGRPGGYGRADLWITTRKTTNDPWGEPANLGPMVNSPSGDGGPALYEGGFTLYFNSGRPGGFGSKDLYKAPIIPIVDFNGDRIVDTEDMCIMVDHWGTDNSLCDIGPMPWGDGIVDVQDLIILSEHLFEVVNDPALIAHWPLDETQGILAYDDVAHCDGVLLGDPVWQPDGGVVDGALQFDGIDDYVSTNPVLNPADGAFSVVAWVMGNVPGQTVLSQAGRASWLCTDSVEGYLITELEGSGRPSSGPLLSEVKIADGTWHRIGLVWDSSCRHLFVDGIEVAKDTAPLSTLEDAYGGFYFGAGSTLAPGSFFSGLIDDVRIYNRVVNP